MFSIPQFIEWLENQGLSRGEVEGGKVPRILVKGVWQTVETPLSREAIESALLECLSPTHKRELPKTEGRFWFRVERPQGAWMMCVQWKSISARPARRVTFVSQAAMSDPIEAAETAGLMSAAKLQEFKSGASAIASHGEKANLAPRNLEQMRDAGGQIPKAPPPLPLQTPPQQSAPWEGNSMGIAPPPLPPEFSPPAPRSQSPDAGKHWEPPTYTPPPPPSALEKQLDALSPGTWSAGFGLIGAAILLFSLVTVRGCNGQGSYSPMLAKEIRKDANENQKWQNNGVRLDRVTLRKIDEDSYEGTGIYSDGGGATVEVEIESWTWSNTPSTWSYKVTSQEE